MKKFYIGAIKAGGYIYMYSLMLLKDFFFNLFYLFLSLFKQKEIEDRTLEFHIIRSLGTEESKDKYLKNKYEWIPDPIKGLLNWNPRCLEVFFVRNFRDDCDGFAWFADKMFDDGVKYSIIPLNPLYWNEMHVVYVRNNKVYSSGYIHKKTLLEFISDFYDGRECTFIKLV